MAAAPSPSVYRWRDAVLTAWTDHEGYGYTISWGSDQGHKAGASYGQGDQADGLWAGVCHLSQVFGDWNAPGLDRERQAKLRQMVENYQALQAA
jgi:hypothetical protein